MLVRTARVAASHAVGRSVLAVRMVDRRVVVPLAREFHVASVVWKDEGGVGGSKPRFESEEKVHEGVDGERGENVGKEDEKTDWFGKDGATIGDAASAGADSARRAAESAKEASKGVVSRVSGVGSFLLDAVYGVFGVERRRGDPHADDSARAYPWVEFVDRSTKTEEGYRRAYRNTETGEVTMVKPDDFDKYGRAQELDLETSSLVLVKREKSRWETYSDMLSDTPLMRALYEASAAVSESPVGEAARSMRERVREKSEDVREQWEVSQNPIVYRASAAYDTVFGETEQARAVGKIQQLDPSFDAGPEFVASLRRRIIPDVVSAFLRGDRLTLAAWCTDNCLERINAVLRARETEGVTVNSTILGVNDVNIIGAKAPTNDDPTVVVSAMVQQIHCMRKKEEVVEGSDDEIRAVIYVFALQRQYLPDKGGLVWQVAELTYTGGMLYL